MSARRLADGRLQLALRDTAERRRAADALHESEERYERLAASAPDAILVEASGRVVFANPALRRLLGLQPGGAVAGRALADLLHPDERARRRGRSPARWRREAAGVRLSTRLRRADGSTAEVEGTATAVTYRGRQAVQVLLREASDDRILEGDAYHDAMTGLTSPMLIPDRLSVAIAQAYRHRARVGVLHVDLDRFGEVNRRLGRSLGDRVLRAAARRLSHCVRVGDTAGRLDADAFVLVLPGLHHGEDATRIADKVLRAVRKPFPLTEGTVSLTASVGVAIFPEDGEDAPALLASAEQSARRALEAGGDRASRARPARSTTATTPSSSRRASGPPSAAAAWASTGRPRRPASSTTSPSSPSRRGKSWASRRCCAGSTRSSASSSPRTSSRSPTSPASSSRSGPGSSAPRPSRSASGSSATARSGSPSTSPRPSSCGRRSPAT